MTEPGSVNCFFCEGPYHPSTGAWYSERVQVCGPCVRHFWIEWLKGWVKPRKGMDFYGKHNRDDGRGPWVQGR